MFFNVIYDMYMYTKGKEKILFYIEKPVKIEKDI